MEDLFIALFNVLIIAFVLTLPVLIIGLVANWKLFKKAGKSGWEALIPFYSNWVFVEISGLAWWWFLIILAPAILIMLNDDLYSIANSISFFASFNCWYNVSKKFKKDETTSILAGIFSFVFIFIYAFSKKNQYYAETKTSQYGILGKFFDKKDNMNNNVAQNVTTTDVNAQANFNNSSYCIHCGAKIDGNYNFCPSCGKEK